MPSHLRRVTANLEDAYAKSTASLIVAQDRMLGILMRQLTDYEAELGTATNTRKDEINDRICDSMGAVSKALATSIAHAKLGPQAAPAENPDDVRAELLS